MRIIEHKIVTQIVISVFSGFLVIFVCSISLTCGQVPFAIAPCVWIEKGGFFTPGRYYNSSEPFIQPRISCGRSTRCNYRWTDLTNDRSITFKWIGTDDMRDYLFQMNFCQPIHGLTMRECTNNPGEVAYELIQRGTWLFLAKSNCKCNNVAEPTSFIYPRKHSPTHIGFEAHYMKMQCFPQPICPVKNAPCYIEPIVSGQVYMGDVLCTCPKKTYCPIYFIHKRREETIVNGQRKFIVRCRPRAI